MSTEIKPITLATLPDATEQEVFDWVVSNLLKQGEKSLGDQGGCRYRGNNGLKCAAGWCISDDEYSKVGEHIENLIWGTWDIETLRCLQLPLDHNQLILEMQCVHDDTGVQSWPFRFREIAVKYNLDVSMLNNLCVECPT